MIRAAALRRESPAARHIPYAAHVGEDLIITRSGDYLQTLKLAG
jgi:type IV secretion system protein VirB4